MKLKRFFGTLTAAALFISSVPVIGGNADKAMTVSAEEWCFAGETCDPLHDTSRDIQKEGVGNPLNFGERNTPADASTEEIRAINHKMTVQEVKYALYKEIDEHWDLISTRLGQPDREKMYALFLGLGSRESTLGEGKIGSDHETAYEDGWGVNSAHAYGTLQTAVTAFKDCDPKFMPEDNVPEMFQYSFTPSNFYDCIISNHMGIRKILHFAEICINEEGMHGYQVVRNSLKGFNTGWCYMAEDDGAYATYADEICAMAQFYYNEGHLYDNVFTWTSANGEKINKYRTANRWDWWGDTEPSMAPIEEKTQTTTTTTTSTTISTTTTTSESTTSEIITSTTEPPVTTEPYTTWIPTHKLTVETPPDTTVYLIGQKLDLTGMTMKFSTDTGSSMSTDIILESEAVNDINAFQHEYMVHDYGINEAGEYTFIVSMISDESYTTSFTVKYVSDIICGDANCDGKVDISDAVLIMQTLSNPSKYKLTEQGRANADCSGNGDGVTNADALAIQKYKLEIIKSLPETK